MAVPGRRGGTTDWPLPCPARLRGSDPWPPPVPAAPLVQAAKQAADGLARDHPRARQACAYQQAAEHHGQGHGAFACGVGGKHRRACGPMGRQAAGGTAARTAGKQGTIIRNSLPQSVNRVLTQGQGVEPNNWRRLGPPGAAQAQSFCYIALALLFTQAQGQHRR